MIHWSTLLYIIEMLGTVVVIVYWAVDQNEDFSDAIWLMIVINVLLFIPFLAGYFWNNW